ncbi:tetratricopeptide repeat protein [Streptomyces xiamenensis]
MSRREKFRRQQEQNFVGRSGELAVFEANLRRDTNADDFRPLFHVRGQSGVGKSTLVRRWKGYAERARAATVLLDDSVHGPLEAMKAISDQLHAQGLSMNAFTKRLADLRQRQKAAEHTLPHSEGSPGTEAIAHAGLTAAGAVLGVPLGVDSLARSAGQAWGQRRDRRDSGLLLDPISELTKAFVKELDELSRDWTWVVLFFDVYERTGPALDRWLCDLVWGERYGELPLKVLVVMSGQGRLTPAVWGEMTPFMEEVVLDSFTEEEARDLLARKGVTDEDIVTTVLHLSGRLPVLVDMLASHQPADPGAVIDPAETAVERFLKWEDDPTRRQAILDCALPQEVDADIYRALANPDAAAGTVNWLRSLPFITSHAGRYRYHDIVRDQMLRLQRTRSATDWTRRHTTLADYHAHQLAALETAVPEIGERWENDQWRDHRAAEMYHRLCTAPHETRLTALEDCVHAAAANVETLSRWVRLIREAGRDSGQTAVTGWADSLGTSDSGETDPETALREILAEPFLPTTTRALAHTARGYYRHIAGNHEQALADLDRAIELQPHNAWNHHWRGRVHHAAGNHSQALVDLDRAIELQPHEEAHGRWRDVICDEVEGCGDQETGRGRTVG